jgi:hypothetical protein
MHTTKLLVTLIASLSLAACVGGVDAGGGGDVVDPDPTGTGGGGSGSAALEAKKLFTDNVQPIIAAKCIGCHNVTGPVGNITGFVDADKATAYATATGYQAVIGDLTPAGAPILTIVTVGMHKGMRYEADQITKITSWLNKEVESRAGGGGGTGSGGTGGGETPQAASQRLLGEWSGCMTLANFEAADMRNFGNVNAGGGGNCKTCHALGEFGHIVSNVSQPFFQTITENKYYLLQYFSVDLSMGVPAAKVIINTRSFAGVGNRLAPHEAHPGFNPTNNAGMTALQKFYTDTMAKKTAGTCDPPRLKN